jgi:hypothetical protein
VSFEGQGELLEEKLIPHGMKGGERDGPLDQRLQVAVAGVEATQEVQHQGTVTPGFGKANRMRTMYVPGSELTYTAIT